MKNIIKKINNESQEDYLAFCKKKGDDVKGGKFYE